MFAHYLGTLPRQDPLHEILAAGAFAGVRDPVVHVESLSPHRLVYRYREERSRLAVVGKFFRLDEPDETKRERMKGEYGNLVQLREMGFAQRPFSVVRPIGREEMIGLAVVEEHVEGRDLDHFLRRAAQGEAGPLARRLDRLASFLAALHRATAQGRAADLGQADRYFTRVSGKLARQEVIDAEGLRELRRLEERWLGRSRMQAEEVTVHGDATPTNFLFAEGGDVVAIDLERMRRADGAWDAGMVCGELKHAFLWRAGDAGASEPFIRGFLKAYARGFDDPEAAFRRVTRRLPFYMALTELRIARNGWLDRGYRRRLAIEARECLRWGLEG